MRKPLAAVGAALVLATPAAAHTDASPAFLQAGGVETISLTGHNDRDVAMTEFAVTVPDGLRIDEVSDFGRWTASADESTATWTSAGLEPDAAETFRIALGAPTQTGAVTLATEARYPDGGVVRSPVVLTVVPADEGGFDRATLGVVLVGLLLVCLGVALTYRRRRIASDR